MKTWTVEWYEYYDPEGEDEDNEPVYSKSGNTDPTYLIDGWRLKFDAEDRMNQSFTHVGILDETTGERKVYEIKRTASFVLVEKEKEEA